MKAVRWLDKHLEEVISVVLLAVMTLVIAYQIVMRLLGKPASWSEESARYMFAWLIYISSAYAVKKRSHIKVEIVSLLLGKKGNLILDLIADGAFLFFSLVIMRYGWPYVTKWHLSISRNLHHWGSTWRFLIIPLLLGLP